MIHASGVGPLLTVCRVDNCGVLRCIYEDVEPDELAELLKEQTFA